MAEVGAAISSTLSLATKLLHVVDELAEDSSSSSSDQPNKAAEIKEDLMRLMRVLEQIKPHVSDAEEISFADSYLRFIGIWPTDLGKVAYKAEDVLDGYYYQVLQRQAEAGAAANSCKRKGTQILDLDGNQIKQIIRNLDDFSKDMLHLRLKRDNGGPMQIDPTPHFVDEQAIFGRDIEKEKLIDLLSECGDGKVISVVAVIGTGGIGKTTLVQCIYNDRGLRQRFHKVGWICLSGDFNVERLIRETLKSITNQDCDLNNLSALQERLCKEIRGKRLLLVLDDVWIEDIRLWESFCTPFTSAKSVKIIITTRKSNVARMVAERVLYMGRSSENECWSLFQHYAFGINENVELKLVEIGREIMMKCQFLPLAIKLVATMLRHEAEEKTWREVLESKIWKEFLFERLDGASILPPLIISYLRLPAYLKPCFLYCSMFPKDYEFNVEYLSQLWVAHGYIGSRGGSRKAGQEYIKQLWMRSFFICQFSGSDFKNSKLKLQTSFMIWHCLFQRKILCFVKVASIYM